LDADLQDDIGVFDQFIEKYDEGCEVVYGVRKARKKDSFFKRTTARMFYKFMNFAGAEVVYDHADYRLLGSKALEALEDYNEVNLFLRGIVPQLGFKSDKVYYDRNERAAGESKYPFKKMVNFAFDGITSFSVKPLRVITILGLLACVVSAIGLIYGIVSYFVNATWGWTSLICSIWFGIGMMMLCLGVIGEYIGKIYVEVKQRPRYNIDEVIE
ncbi:MAG: glycosyltransferase, partial [Clostridia bacterium]|nr:glycosyltransferase [Clostridia bacterium]